MSVVIVGLIALQTHGVDNFFSILFALVTCIGIVCFSLKILAGGDVKLILAYLLGIDLQWWSVVFMLITSIGGIMALTYLVYGYLTDSIDSVRQKGLPYGVPIAIGGCFGVWLSTI